MTPPTRARVRLGYAMELIIVLAGSMAMLRDGWTEVISPSLTAASPLERMFTIGGTVLTALALGGGIGLAIEATRGRPASTWGLGRWVWAFSACYAALALAHPLVHFVLLNARHGKPAASDLGAIGRVVRTQFHTRMLGGFTWAILALCLTSWFARSPRDPDPDAREWLGRLYACLVIGTAYGALALSASR